MYCMIVCLLLFNLMVVLSLFLCSCLAVMSMLAELIKTYWWSFKTTVATGAVVDHSEMVWLQYYLQRWKCDTIHVVKSTAGWVQTYTAGRIIDLGEGSGFFKETDSHPLIYLQYKNSKICTAHFLKTENVLFTETKAQSIFFHLISSVPYVWLVLTKLFNISLYWGGKREHCWDSCLPQQLFLDLYYKWFSSKQVSPFNNSFRCPNWLSCNHKFNLV